jgi:hypothetical protein
MKQTTWRADPLVWGHGPRVFEVFLEPTCPFSVKAPAASGRKMKFAGTTILRFENGRIAEELGQEDALSAMLQLGLIRLPELEMVQERPGGPLPRGWNNMSGPSETGR